MDSRKSDTERALNLLKILKSRLNKPEEKSLRKAMEKLIESLESQLFDALLDIQEFYEVTLSNAIYGGQPPIEPLKEIVVEVQPPVESKPKREKSKKSRRRQKSQEGEDDVEDRRTSIKSPEDLPVEQEYQYEEPQHEMQLQNPPVDEDYEDQQNPWLFFEIILKKSKKGYGFAVAGGYDKNHYEGDNGIFVTKIIPGGAAEVDGQLKIDDVIVSVNETNLEYVTHEMAVDTLKNAGLNMTLIIRRLKDEFYTNDQANVDQYQEPQEAFPGMYSPATEHAAEQEPSDDGSFQQFEVILTKRQGAGLGFSIQGGYNGENPDEDSYVSISKITPGGLAEVDGRLDVNDILLMVDDRSLNGLTHDECVAILKNTGRTVKLFVGRFIEVQPEEPVVEKTEKKKKKKHKRDRNED